MSGRGNSISYSAAELAWIEAHAHLPRAEAHILFCIKFRRSDVTRNHIKALCTRRKWATGRTGYFPKGHVPANLGKKMPFNPNSASTRFKKGQLPHNTKFAGHERVSKDGYVEISIDEVNPHTGFARRYVQKHRHLWEKANGPVPQGKCLKSLDGDKTNTDPSNWIAIPRAMLPRLSGRHTLAYHDAPDELKPIIMALARLEHAAREKRKSAT